MPTILIALSVNNPLLLSVNRNVTIVVPTAPIVPVIAPVLPSRTRPDGKEVLEGATENVLFVPPPPSVPTSVCVVDELISNPIFAPAAVVHPTANPIAVVLVAIRPEVELTLTL